MSSFVYFLGRDSWHFGYLDTSQEIVTLKENTYILVSQHIKYSIILNRSAGPIKRAGGRIS